MAVILEPLRLLFLLTFGFLQDLHGTKKDFLAGIFHYLTFWICDLNVVIFNSIAFFGSSVKSNKKGMNSS